MAVESLCTILGHDEIAPDTYSLRLRPDVPVSVQPGRFLNLSIPGVPLRRPLSICETNGDELRIVYRAVGKGTRLLRDYKGETLSALLPLGNGFTIPKPGSELLVLGGGIGCAPLLGLIRAAAANGVHVTVVFGFKTPKEALFWDALRSLPVRAYIGYDSEGENAVLLVQRHHLDAMPFCACGPLPMLQAADKVLKSSGQYSLEARMGCGFGACMGCAVEMKSGMRRICKDGPVFDREEILWASLR